MDTLKLGQELKTREPQVLLDPELRPGRYRVRLVIESTRGVSAAAQIELIVAERGRTPTGPLRPADPLTPLRPAPISRAAEIPAAVVTAVTAVTAASTTTTATPKSRPTSKKKAKAPVKAKAPAKPPKKDKRK